MGGGRLLERVRVEVPDHLAELTRLLAELSELLLNACAAACAAADPLTEASPIAREYEQSRQFALSALTSNAMQLCRAGAVSSLLDLPVLSSLSRVGDTWHCLVPSPFSFSTAGWRRVVLTRALSWFVFASRGR